MMLLTWSRIVGVTLRESIIDHIYVKDPTTINVLKSMTPVFGDHKMKIFRIDVIKPKIDVSYRRDWRHYSKDKLCNELCSIDWSNDIDDVQGLWNDFECKLISIVNKIHIAQFLFPSYKCRRSSDLE